jgi:hypothetical protein
MSNPLWEQSDHQRTAFTAGNIETSVIPDLASAVAVQELYSISAFIPPSVQTNGSLHQAFGVFDGAI